MNLFKKNDKKNFFILTLIFIPIFFIVGELLSYGILTFKNNFADPEASEKINIRDFFVPDVITGSVRVEISDKERKKNKFYYDKNGLIKTAFNPTNEKNSDYKGILITGNSVALGYPQAENKDFSRTFVNLLESSIRKMDNSYDIVNLSQRGFNSWQEYIQLVRYFNTKENFKNLPSNIKLIASVGGIQDFWGFVDLLNLRSHETNEYYKANGLMSLDLDDSTDEEFYRKVFKAEYRGDLKVSSKIFLNSLISYFKRSNMNKLRHYIFPKKNFRTLNNYQKAVPYENNLKKLVKEKINITFDEYKETKEIVINSVARNINAIVALQKDVKTLFIYLPTKFGSTEPKNDIQNRFMQRNLNVMDLGILENDYKESLLARLSQIKELKVIDLNLKAKESWFLDESHYSNEGHKIIFSSITPIVKSLL